MAIKLYDLCGADRAFRFSPACWRTRMALAHKGLEVETIATRFTEIASIEGGTQKTVPVIVDGDLVLRDSFEIALYLEETYPDQPSLFGGVGGEKVSQFIHWWSNATVDAQLSRFCTHDIYLTLAPEDQVYFRQNREARWGMTLEEAQDRSEMRLQAFSHSLFPMQLTLRNQAFIGGDRPIYADYCLMGSFQWARMVTDFEFLPTDDPIYQWFERCLDLYDGLARNAKV